MIENPKSKRFHPLIQRSKTLLLAISLILMVANIYTLTSTRDLARTYTYKQHKATWFLFYLTKEFTELVSVMPHALDSEQDFETVKLKYELTWSRFDLILNNNDADDFLQIDGTLPYFTRVFEKYKQLEPSLLTIDNPKSLDQLIQKTDKLYLDVVNHINDNFKIQSPMYVERKKQAQLVTNIQLSLILLLFFSIGLVCFIWYKEAQHHRLLALTDPLTGIGNRLSMFNSISNRPEKRHFSLFLLDLNGFKAINDELGHLAGDSVLTQVTKRLVNIPNSKFELFRMGGDEFAIVFDNAEPLELARMHNLIEACFKADFIIDDNQPRKLGTSIGVSSYPLDSTDINQLIHVADQKMYAMKNSKKRPLNMRGNISIAL